MNFFYRELGSFEGRTLMIVHGWLGMSEHWLSIGKYLADIGYHVIIPDLPNHGRSFHTDMFSYQSMARFLHDFLSNHSCGKPILAGHSMGGKIVMTMLDLYPDDYQSAVIIDILPKAYPDLCKSGGIADLISRTNLSAFEGRSDLLSHFKSFVSDKGWLALLMQNVSVEHQKTKRPFAATKRRFIKIKRRSILPKRRKNLLRWKSNAPMMSKYMNQVAGEVPLSVCKLPVLLIRGDNSEFTLEQDLHLFSDLYPNSQIITIRDASHWVFVDKPAQFVKEFATYLEQIAQ